MADNTTLNSGTGGDVIASDDILGVKHQRVKVEFGADGSATDVSSSNPLPVIAAANSGVDIGDVTINNAAGSTSVPVQGAAAADAAVAGNPVLLGGRASAAAPTDVSADGDAVSLWTTLKGALHVADGGGTLSVDDGGGALTVDGTVGVSGTVTVDASGTTVPVSNAGLTELAAAINASSQVDVNIAASNATVTVSGTVTANLSATDNAVLDNIDADTSAIQTAVELIDDAIVADDAAFTPATTKVMMAGFEFDDTTPDTVNEGDAGAARMSSRREIYTQIRDAAGNERGANVNASGQLSVSVDNTVTVGSHAVTNAGTFAVQESGSALTALQLIDDGIATVASAIPTKGMAAVGTDGTNARILKTDTSGELQVDVLTLPNVTVGSALPAGTNAIGKLAANSGVDIGDVDVLSIVPGTGATNLGKAEDAAHTSGDVGVMALGVRNDTPNTALAGTDLDYLPIATYRTGAVRTAIPEEDFAALGSNHVKKYYTSTGAVTDGIVWSPAAGKRWYVTDIFINVSAAATVTLEDDLGAGDSVVWKAELAANSGWSHSFGTPLFSGEDAADLLVTTSAGNVYITVTGYEI